MKRTLIIAEAGVNHNGSLNLAKKLVDKAKECNVDIVKFQTAKPEALVSKYAQKADYQKETTGKEESQLSMIKKILLTFSEYEELAKYCETKAISFLSTPFDLESIEFLKNFNMPFWKIPSGEITNYPYLVKIADTHMPVIMSTGMCELEEIDLAVKVLKENGCDSIKLLHCNTEYPTPYEDANLLAMNVLRNRYHVEVGYSDHTLGIEIPIAAVAMGATVIEKHFTLSREMEGPDHKASLEPDELSKMVQQIRHVEQAIGQEEKKPSFSEKKNINIARKSIVASRNICLGEIFSEENITTKRPGDGISPMRWNEVLGQRATRNFDEDELIEI